MDSGLIERNVFAFHFSHNPDEEDSELTIGYYDESRFVDGTLQWFDVTHPVFWALELADIRIGDESLGLCGPESILGKDCLAAPDSGMSYLTMPDWAIAHLSNHAKLGGPFLCDDNDQFEQEDLVYVLSDGREYRLPSHHWVSYTSSETGQGYCSSLATELTI